MVKKKIMLTALVAAVVTFGFVAPSNAAYCNDGSISSSSGKGTCSWHGGVTGGNSSYNSYIGSSSSSLGGSTLRSPQLNDNSSLLRGSSLSGSSSYDTYSSKKRSSSSSYGSEGYGSSYGSSSLLPGSSISSPIDSFSNSRSNLDKKYSLYGY